MPQCGFIQAGGRSSRMKCDKAWLEIQGAPMIERVVAAARPALARLGIIVNAANPQLERYAKLAESYGADLIFDLHEHRGPLGGIHTALTRCRKGESALILACDLPFITTDFLFLLCETHQQANPPSAIRHPLSITVPLDQSNRPQPLAAIYDQSLAVMVCQMLAANEFKVDLLFSRAPTQQVRYAQFAHLPGAERFFININTPEDYCEALT